MANSFFHAVRTIIPIAAIIRRIYTKKSKAYKILRESFSASDIELDILRKAHSQTDLKKSDAFLIEELPKQSIAIDSFKSFVKKTKRDEYQKAWDSYKNIVLKGVSTTVWDGLFDGSGNKQDYISKVKELVHKILSFNK